MKLRMTVGAAILAAVPAVATAAPCQPGTLRDYIALGGAGCQLNGVWLANFKYLALPEVVRPWQIQVAPQPSVGMTGVLKLTAPWRASARQVLSSSIRYTVMLRQPSPTSQGIISLHMGPEHVFGANGTVRINSNSRVAYLGVFEVKSGGWSQIRRDAERLFTPPSALRDVENRIFLDGGDAGVTLSSFSVAFGVR